MSAIVISKTRKFGTLSLSLQMNRKSDNDFLGASSGEVFELITVNGNISYDRARNASLLERSSMEASEKSNLTYGEFTFETMRKIFETIRDHKDDNILSSCRGGKFYDLGSGCGRTVLMACTLHDFEVSCGVEIMGSLHDIAEEARVVWGDALRDEKIFRDCTPTFILGSILDTSVCDWSDGDIIVANSTCFTDELFDGMAELSLRLKPGSYFVTLTKNLPVKPGKFDFVKELRLEMSW